MGYYMVKWGAGVHQWQVTLDQLFHQLYVCSRLTPNTQTLTLPVGQLRPDHVLSTQLPRQNGYSTAIPPSFRARP
jgi:hypothetical protein